jgi:hypothetical protein
MNTVTLPILPIAPIKRRPSIQQHLNPSWVLVTEIDDRYQVVLQQKEYDHENPSKFAKPFTVYTAFIYDAILKEEFGHRDARTYQVGKENYHDKIKVCIDVWAHR